MGTGVTGHSSAKVTSLHGLAYQRLRSKVGTESARIFGEANEAGLRRISELVDRLGIECGFRRRPNYTYAESPTDRQRIEQEAQITAGLGLPAGLVDDLDLPFPVAAAVRFDDQAEIDPLRYVAGLAAAVPGEGSHVFEGTRARGVGEGSPCTVQTDRGSVVRAGHVIVATHFPFLDRGLYFARLHPERSYVLAARLRRGAPAGMYLSTESPPHSLRPASAGDEEFLLVGGESHRVGEGDPGGAYERLERWARDRFDIESVPFRWSTQDNITLDGLPYVGQLWPFGSRLLTATGLGKWGIALGTASAMVLSDRVLGKPNPWASTFDSLRVRPRASAPSLAKESLAVAGHFFLDRLKRLAEKEVSPGEGAIVRDGTGQAALYVEENGTRHRLSARCTHLGCIVTWNPAERSWDCPCHGSRFSHRGDVLQGPAVDSLPPA